MKQIRMGLSAIAVLVCLIFATTFGMTDIKAEPTAASLTLTEAVPGSSFSLYQIQRKESDGSFTTTKEFSSYPISLELTDASKMREASSTLESYIIADHIQAYDTKTADSKGMTAFTNLPAGLYLALGENAKSDSGLMQQAPVLAYLPTTGEDQRESYDLTVKIKTTPMVEMQRYEVFKVWDDHESTSRPGSIEVCLYQDGKPYDTEKLDKDNGWKFVWESCEANHTYTITEVTRLDGYEVTITEESGIFTVRNTKKEVPPDHPDVKIPQTGQLWWPVGLLAVCGIVFLAIGSVGRKEKRNRRK